MKKLSFLILLFISFSFASNYCDSVFYHITGLELILNQPINKHLTKHIKTSNIKYIETSDSIKKTIACYKLEDNKLISIQYYLYTNNNSLKDIDSIYLIFKSNYDNVVKSLSNSICGPIKSIDSTDIRINKVITNIMELYLSKTRDKQNGEWRIRVFLFSYLSKSHKNYQSWYDSTFNKK